MNRSGDLVIGRSGDRKGEFTAETRRRGENFKKLTTETQRHGERSGDSGNAYDGLVGEAANSFYGSKIGHAAYICHPERVGANATPSRRTPTKIVPEHTASGSSYETLKNVLVTALQTIRATFREIFDESAYDRFLLRTHASRSRASYQEFTRERDAAMVKKPRCC
ncbi:MAG: hypothetical protein LAO76_08855 [Acidobacteriia bacterium]|nr:hypothetical protein [Terriglobia bacterium]